MYAAKSRTAGMSDGETWKIDMTDLLKRPETVFFFGIHGLFVRKEEL